MPAHRALLAVGSTIAAVAVLVTGAVAVAKTASEGGLSLEGGLSTPEAARKKQNVVMIMTDDQAAHYLHVMPNVRRLLVNQGTRFTNAYVSYPLCCPSRATYLTGQYPHNHGVTDNKAPKGGYYALRRKGLLPHWMDKQNYHTVHIGKYLNGYGTKNPREVPPGWDEWHGLVDPTTYRMWGYKINHNGRVKKYGRPRVENPKLYQTDVLSRLATGYIDRRAPKRSPFFLSVAPLASHLEGKKVVGPNDPNPRPAPRHRGAFKDKKLPRGYAFNDRDPNKPRHIRSLDKLGPKRIKKITRRYRAQLASLLAVDEMVGKIVKRLRKHGELRNTTIMFTSDNGFFNGEHRIPGGKIHPYPAASKVPLVIRGPGIPKGKKRDTLVTNTDWAATIADVANVKPSRRVDGRSLIPLARDPRKAANRALLFETGPRSGGKRWYKAIRTKRYHYIVHSTGERELYDLRRSRPYLDTVHKRPRYADERRRLANRLRALYACDGRECWTR